MDTLFEYGIVQNVALGALAIHAATLQCFESTGRSNGARLPLLMLVLPLTFHQETRLAMDGKVLNGSFYRCLSENRAITVGLQRRMESMAHLSLRSVNLATASGLVRRVPEQLVHFYPERLSGLPATWKTADEDVQAILGAAKRVGHWIGTVRLDVLCSALHVRF